MALSDRVTNPMNYTRKIINLLGILYFPVAEGGRKALPAREKTESGSPSGAMMPFKS